MIFISFQHIPFPLTIVVYHLVVKLTLSYVIRLVYRFQTGKSRVLLDFRTCLTKLGPAGLASGIDIGFSNWGLELVNISLYTMTKSTTIVFILGFAILLGLERKVSFVMLFFERTYMKFTISFCNRAGHWCQLL